jgi:hypothetical protein
MDVFKLKFLTPSTEAVCFGQGNTTLFHWRYCPPCHHFLLCQSFSFLSCLFTTFKTHGCRQKGTIVRVGRIKRLQGKSWILSLLCSWVRYLPRCWRGEEFYWYSDQEVPALPHNVFTLIIFSYHLPVPHSSILHYFTDTYFNRLSQYSLHTPPSSYITPSSLNHICNPSTIPALSTEESNYPPQNYLISVILMSGVSGWTC